MIPLFDIKEFKINTQEWKGMPEFISENKQPIQQIIVSFETFEDVQAFGLKLGFKVTKDTNSIWFPLKDKKKKDHVYVNRNWGKDDK
jgi:hypothetical protein